MKHIKYLLIFLMATLSTFATDRYQYIEEAEYFINTDPGEGEGTPIDVGLGFSVDINLNDVAYNYGDIVFVRVKNENGVWSAPYGRKLGTNKIVDARAYKVTYPVPDYRKLIEVEMNVTPKLLDGLIATATSDEMEGDNLQPGDTILVQFKGINGIWGPLQPVILSKPDMQIATPGNLNVEDISGETPKAKITWLDNSDAETGYIIERKDMTSRIGKDDDPLASWQQIATVEKNITEYIDEDIDALNEYCWRIKGYGIKDWMESEYSQEGCLMLVGVEDLEASNIALISPNPANKEITIKSQRTIRDYSIVNMLGEELRKGKLLSDTDNNIQIERLPAGIYFIIMQESNKEKIVEKFVKY